MKLKQSIDPVLDCFDARARTHIPWEYLRREEHEIRVLFVCMKRSQWLVRRL